MKKKFFCTIMSILFAMAFSSCQGANGKDGTKWYTGIDVPSMDISANVGDFYLDTDDSNIYQLTDGGWVLISNIKGDPGEQGPQGEKGPQGEQGETGERGPQGESSTLDVAIKDIQVIYETDEQLNKVMVFNIIYTNPDIEPKIIKVILENSIEIKFESNGGSVIDSIYCVNFNEVDEPQQPTKENHEFKGWYYDEALNNKVYWPIMPIKDTTLYAKWEKNPIVPGRNLNESAWQVPEAGWSGKEVTINFYSTMGKYLVDSITPFIEEFEELYPSITVNHTQPGGYDQVCDKIKTELPTGQGPDLAYCYPDHVALYNKTKTVVTLDNLITDPEIGLTQEQEEDFIQGYYEEGRQFGDGLMYTLPFSKSTDVLYYNDDYFKANNLKVPDHWFSTGADDDSSMEYVCAKLLELDPNCVPLGYDSEANWFITMCEQLDVDYTSATGDHFLFNNAGAKEFVTKFKAWKEKGYFTTQTIYGGYTSGLFVSQKSYMSIGSSVGAIHQRPSKVDGKYPFEVGIAPIPQHDANNKKAISQGPSICMFNHGDADKVMASWLFLKHLTTNVELQASFSLASSYVPVLNSVKENEIFAGKMEKADGGDNVALLSAKVCMEQADTYFTSPAFIGSSEARTQAGNIMVAAFELGDKSDSKAFATALDKIFSDAIVECENNS